MAQPEQLFANPKDLEEWLVKEKRVIPAFASEVAPLLFVKNYIVPSAFENVSAGDLELLGVSKPAANSISHLLKPQEAKALVAVGRRQSFLDPLSVFLNSTRAEGCLPTDALYCQRTVALAKLRRCLRNRTHALIHAPPASGKTSLLQAFVRSLLDDSPRVFHPLILQGRSRAEQMSTAEGRYKLLKEVSRAVSDAMLEYEGLEIVLIVDDGERVYPVIHILAKECGVPMIVAASHYSDGDDSDSPAFFEVMRYST